MHTSDNGINLIRECEGFAAKVYNDVGHPAIGYGHDLQPGESFPNGITADESLDLLRHDLATRYEPFINSLIPAECTSMSSGPIALRVAATICCTSVADETSPRTATAVPPDFWID